MLPWQNLRFWKERSILDPILSKDAIVLPCKGILKVCAMHLPDIWKSRCCLGEIEGFDHSIANKALGACGNLPPSLKGICLPYFIWQCGETKELSDVFSVMNFNFSEPLHACYGKIR
ncbi:protein arginine N-methyltransferase 7-like, partial [Phalaenopsis equestris]|uniref:protein arginine N-methyltransferase 7-like n=1 Tax=Phalaenopsis equestris TaxID=78828 RepID=UPI0009E3669F